MAVDLKSLSPKELQALITNAESHMQEARANQVHAVKEKIDAILHSSGLTLADIYGTQAKTGKRGARGGKGSVAPKYRNPENPSETWTGRGRSPLWFASAIKKRGVTAESLLIGGAPKATKKVTKKASKKSAKKATRKKVRR
ncbi:H-NS histone family protein [Dyella mobilis]|uniref:H-NS histone family protein n=1 Tax=Dyella mobilis TaxID=1849582 RepID=A0ABS2KIJ0_9GAMM|nr:H-NS histone family protein [Dyella mobilis]MBM7130998.1 H-NS histone family protein [Dyella mobilis]GLQ97625.1 histone-like nucleoid-structuring protein H-NS [Dyella mobilis]